MRLSPVLAAAALAAALAVAGCQGDDQDALTVVVSLPDQDIGGAAKATLLVDYSGTGARILGEAGGAACAFILPGIDGDFVDDHKGTLTVHTKGSRALHGPLDIAACRMKAGDHDATPASLRDKLSVKISAAEDAAGKAIDLAARTKAHGASEIDESAIEAAQAEAVKQAASIAPAPSAGAGGAGAVPGGPATPGAGDRAAGGTATAPKGEVMGAGAAPPPPPTAAAPVAAYHPPAPAPPPPSRPATPQSLVKDPLANRNQAQANAAADGGGAPTGPAKDPSYTPQGDNPNITAYTIEIAVATQSRFGALQFEITHLGSSGGFIGAGDKIDCVPMVEAIIAGNYLGERVAKLGLISLQGILTPAPILRCGFRTREALSPASFLIDVTDASDTNSEALTPLPTVVVSQVFRR